MRDGPILISEGVEYKDWIQKIKPVILDRINLYANNEIKFNLLALVPDKRIKFIQEKALNENKKAYITRKLSKEQEQENSSDDKEVKIIKLNFIN